MNKYSTTTTTTIIHHSQSSSSMSLLLLISMLSFITLSTSAAVETSLLLYKDPRVPTEDRVTDLLSRMTLPEKIGQMSQIDRSVASPEVIKNLFIGSILNGGTSAPTPDTTPSQWADMIDAFQKSSMETRLQIPMIYGTDAVHGHNNVFGSTIFPHNIGLGAARDEDLMVRIGKATALEIRATGIPYTFAPCIAVCRDPRWGRCYESYSEDTDIVRSMSKIILGLQGVPPVNYTKGYPFVAGGNKVIGCAKHYVGDGGTIEGTNEHNTVSSYSDLFQVHIRPYIDALEMSVSTVMVSYSSWNGIKTHANPYLLSKVLKQEFGFQGFLISDWEGIDRVTSPPGSNYKNSVKEVINAGVDMVMIPTNYQKFITDLMELVLSGDVPMTRIDDAVRRILRVKFIAGMFEQPNADRSLLGNIVGSKKHRELAREAVRKSLVLLKNGKGGKPILPLSKYAPKVLVAGTHANDIGYQCGGWTITWNGAPGNTTIGTTILQGIKSAISKRTEVVFEEKPDQQFMQNNKDFSYSIVAVGEPPYAESQGDDKNLTLSPDAIETIRNVCSKTKCLVIIISGRPLVIEPYLGMIEALVAAWLPGSEAGNGIADVIFGKYDFKGTTILQGIESTVSERTEVVFEEKPDQKFMQNNKDFSYAIVAVGEPPYAVSQGDSNKLTLSPDAIETIRNVCSKTKCLVIIVSGRPMVIEPYVGMMEALVAAWLPGSEAGNGIADVIFGK